MRYSWCALFANWLTCALEILLVWNCIKPLFWHFCRILANCLWFKGRFLARKWNSIYRSDKNESRLARHRFSQKTNERFSFCHDSSEILKTWNFDFKKKPKNKQIGFGKIYGAPICFRFYLTFSVAFKNPSQYFKKCFCIECQWILRNAGR